MIRSFKRALIAFAALMGLAGTAQAGYVTWTDDYDVGTGIYLSGGESYEYFHDITLDGFNPGSDLVTDFLLTIDLQDDQKRDSFEVAFVDIPGLLGDSFVSTFSFGDNAYSGFSIVGLFELNLLGTLSVTVTSVCTLLACGDFLLTGSTLVANGYTHSVPEPSTLALLGLGLLGIGFGTRRRRQG